MVDDKLRFMDNSNDSANNEGILINTPMDQQLVEDGSAGESLDSRRTLNTLFGVFCPVALSMFSACLFLRVGYLVGESGLLLTLLQLGLAYFLLIMTTLSICAISTNGAIAGGGAYYMISRTLGPEFGGALGMLFFWANIFSCALYIAGCVEIVVNTFGPGGIAEFLPGIDQWWRYLYSTILLFLNFCICIMGGSFFTRASAVTLLAVTVCVIMVLASTIFEKPNDCVQVPKENHLLGNVTCLPYTGYNTTTFVDNLLPNWSVDYTQPSAGKPGFGVVFAVLFSSITGIMNGANMSGELKSPSFAIPHGTLYAMTFTFTTYFLVIITTAFTSTHELLINNFHYMQYVNLVSWFVIIGSLLASFSAAAGNLIGASRYIEALADDEIFWGLLKWGKIRYKGNPWVAVVVSWLLIQVVAIDNNLNQIAPLSTVCYLLMYAGTNLACLALELASAPNFRPSFRYFNSFTCFTGFAGCLAMCFVVNPLYAAVALVIFIGLLNLLSFRNFETHWGSITQAMIFHQVRKYLLLLDPSRDHVKFWRPQILLLVANPRSSAKLIDFVNDLKKSGLYVMGHVSVGDWNQYTDEDPLLRQQHVWGDVVKRMNVKAFVEITMAKTVRDGLRHLVHLSGLGGMKPNTVVFGFYDDEVPVQTLPPPATSRSKLPSFLTSRGSPFARSPPTMDIEVAMSSLPPLRDRDDRITPEEYLSMLWDVVKMKKDLILCRNFQQFNKRPIIEGGAGKSKLLIDVWPIDPFNADSFDISNTSSQFLLQIACVLHMVRGWKQRSIIRIFLLEGLRIDDSSSYYSDSIVDGVKKQLQELRIAGSVEVVSTRAVRSSATPSMEDSDQLGSELLNVPESTITELNALMKANSSAAGVVFTQLPPMPRILGAESEVAADRSRSYVERLQKLTDGLPPTVLALGLHEVTTNKL